MRTQELRIIVSESADQDLNCCKGQVHMFEGDLIGFDKLGAHREARRSENQAHGRIVRHTGPVPLILCHLVEFLAMHTQL